MIGGRRRTPVSGLLALPLAVGACVDLPLLDPADPGIPVVGAELRLWRGEARGAAGRLEFEGYIYGHIARNGQRYQRFLDAGVVTVAGRSADRRFPRPAEPLYYYTGTAPGISSPVRLEVGGSEAVAPCTLDLELPVLGWPAGADVDPPVIPRERDLVVPVDLGDSRPDDRVSADVRLTASAATGRETAVALELPTVGTEIVIPQRLLEALPAGRARLFIDIVWERTRTAPTDGSACAPHLTIRATLHAGRQLRLE